MKSDLSNVKIGDKIFTITEGWQTVLSTDYHDLNKIETEKKAYRLDGRFNGSDKFPSAFAEYPFKEQPIEKDSLVYYRNSENHCWAVGYYSHLENGKHFVFTGSKKSTEAKKSLLWNIVTTENPFL